MIIALPNNRSQILSHFLTSAPKLAIQIRLLQSVVLINQVLRHLVVQVGAVDAQRVEIGDVVTSLLVRANDRLDGQMVFHVLETAGS